MNPYSEFVSGFSRLIQQGKSLPLGGIEPAARPILAPNAPRALIFSPHPDDECIIGGLALRLLRELKWNVINVAVTQGSNKARQAERYLELQMACHYLGFGLLQTAANGLEKINAKTREQDPAHWDASVRVIADILTRQQPQAIFFPHDQDWNSSHLGTHWLIMDALARLSPDFQCFLIETEFWGQNDTPNLTIESSEPDLADLVAATSFHVGEVKRNPYHLLLPAWMMDNVRRGAELVGGQGLAAPNFLYATLYRLRRWREGKVEAVLERGRHLSAQDDLGQIFHA